MKKNTKREISLGMYWAFSDELKALTKEEREELDRAFDVHCRKLLPDIINALVGYGFNPTKITTNI